MRKDQNRMRLKKRELELEERSQIKLEEKVKKARFKSESFVSISLSSYELLSAFDLGFPPHI